jgi:hypothetical protein
MVGTPEHRRSPCAHGNTVRHDTVRGDDRVTTRRADLGIDDRADPFGVKPAIARPTEPRP